MHEPRVRLLKLYQRLADKEEEAATKIKELKENKTGDASKRAQQILKIEAALEKAKAAINDEIQAAPGPFKRKLQKASREGDWSREAHFSGALQGNACTKLMDNRIKLHECIKPVIISDGKTRHTLFPTGGRDKLIHLNKLSSVMRMMDKQNPLCRHEAKLTQVRATDLGFSFAEVYPKKPPIPKHGLITVDLIRFIDVWSKEGIPPGMIREDAVEHVHVFMNNQAKPLRQTKNKCLKLKRQLERHHVKSRSQSYTPKVRKCKRKGRGCGLPIAKRFQRHCTCKERPLFQMRGAQN